MCRCMFAAWRRGTGQAEAQRPGVELVILSCARAKRADEVLVFRASEFLCKTFRLHCVDHSARLCEIMQVVKLDLMAYNEEKVNITMMALQEHLVRTRGVCQACGIN